MYCHVVYTDDVMPIAHALFPIYLASNILITTKETPNVQHYTLF